MSIYDRYKTDKTLETEGVWVDFGDGVEVKLTRLNTKAAKEVRRREEKPYARLREIPEDIQEKVLTRIMAQAVIKEWKGVLDEKGKPIPCTAEAVEALLNELPDFREDLIFAAAQRETFKAEEVEAAKGN